MTTPSEVAVPVADASVADKRLHALSWLFVLIQQLKSFAFPLLVLLFTGRGNTWELWGLLGVALLALYSIAQYFTYRYGFDNEGLVIRSGLLQRTVRHVPYARIHNVGLQQSLLHRLFGVAEVRLESAGGSSAEGQMRVLSLHAAHALEQRIRAGATREPQQTEAPAAEPLLALDTGEVIRLGLSSNRGMIVVAAAFGALFSIGDGFVDDVASALRIDELLALLPGWDEIAVYGWPALLLSALLLFGLAMLGLRLLSVLLALLQYHGFRLDEQQGRLAAERGLLGRLRQSLPVRRIQAWTVHESLAHRWLRRQGLRVDSIAADDGQGQSSLRLLLPVATPARIAELIPRWLPRCSWPLQAWQPLHPRAWRRQFMPAALLVVVACLPLGWRFGLAGLWVLALLPLLWVRARIWARHAGWCEEDGLIAVREGWLDRHWRFAEVRKLQALELQQSPFDRRHGMATLRLDTAGASPFEPQLRLRYLPEVEARALYERLAAAMDAATRARIAA
ncbi:MAG TPA: PH domain-containing protein [Arenimonas sp.]|nr:PH domain-containing protein [Arenimonas sp.]